MYITSVFCTIYSKNLKILVRQRNTFVTNGDGNTEYYNKDVLDISEFYFRNYDDTIIFF